MRIGVGRRALAGLLGAAALAATACDPDITTVRFRVPTKIFRFETTRALWNGGPATLPDAPCEIPAECCAPLGDVATSCQAIEPACRAGTCAMTVVLDRALPMWIFREVPDLALLDGSAKRGLRIARASARAAEPLADGPTGSLILYVTPAVAASATHPEAQEVARIPRLRFGDPGGAAEATLTPNAASALRRFATNPTEPLAFVAVTRLPVGALERVPRGTFAVTMDIELVSTPGF